MKTLILAAIRRSVMFTAVTASLFSIQPARAYTVTLKEVGANVVANGSGAFNLTGLTFEGSTTQIGGLLNASFGIIVMGPPNNEANVDGYTGFSGPSNFGSGGYFFPNTGSGDRVDVCFDCGHFIVPQGYLTNTTLSNSMTFNNATFASLGVTPGTYVWSWGTGLRNQNFTLIIGGVGVPDGGSTVSLLGFGLLGLAALRRKLGC
jgi:hypothetical protein